MDVVSDIDYLILIQGQSSAGGHIEKADSTHLYLSLNEAKREVLASLHAAKGCMTGKSGLPYIGKTYTFTTQGITSWKKKSPPH